MSYDERTAARIRAVLARRRDVVERKMFGGLTFMVNGAMCCGVTAEALVVRVGPAAYEAALASAPSSCEEHISLRRAGILAP
ncbi:MAG TPA: TfoX/Sxy family protein [Kofleriaceae bacterium]|nr:TfoX/Sxy family protein [Kofleriaceae bacterium]